jgi:hypothetical protein
LSAGRSSLAAGLLAGSAEVLALNLLATVGEKRMKVIAGFVHLILANNPREFVSATPIPIHTSFFERRLG